MVRNFLSLFRSRSTLLLLASGLSLVLAFPPFYQGWLVWVALLPVLIALRISLGWQKHPFLAGYVVGLLYFGGTFWWIGHVTIPGIIALVLYISLYPALWLWILEKYFEPRCRHGVMGNLKFATAGACLWVALEWMRGWFLTGFGWNNLGVALYQNAPLVQLASLGGTYLLSWLIVFVNISALRTFSRVYGELQAKRPRGPLYEISLALLLVALGFAWGMQRTLAKPSGAARVLRYAAIQPNIPQNAYVELMSDNEILARYEQLSRLALASNPELLLWPEATTNLGVFTDDRLNRLVTALNRNGDFYFLLGAMDFDPQHVYNSAYLFYPNWSGIEIYHKNKLVIFGEYVPLADWLPILRKLVPFGTDMSTGEAPMRLKLPTLSVSLAPLICFEDTLPGFVRSAAALGPDILVNLTNDSWFKESPGAEQHLANALFRTVETDRPMIRCTNTGVTCEVSQQGIIRTRLTDDGSPTGRSIGAQGVLARELRWYSPGTTLYQRWGDWVPLVSALVCLVILWPQRRKSAET